MIESKSVKSPIWDTTVVFVSVGWGRVGCPWPPIRNDIVTPHHLFPHGDSHYYWYTSCELHWAFFRYILLNQSQVIWKLLSTLLFCCVCYCICVCEIWFFFRGVLSIKHCFVFSFRMTNDSMTLILFCFWPFQHCRRPDPYHRHHHHHLDSIFIVRFCLRQSTSKTIRGSVCQLVEPSVSTTLEISIATPSNKDISASRGASVT